MFSFFWVVVVFNGPMIHSAAPFPHIPSLMDSLLFGLFGAAIGITASLYRPIRKSNISRFVSYKKGPRRGDNNRR